MAVVSTKNLKKRNGVYYIRKQYQGKTYFRSLSTSDKDVALRRAKALWNTITEKRFADLESTKLRNGYAKVGQVIQLYLATVQNYRRPSTKTATGNVATLRKIIRATSGGDPDEASAAVLTGALVRKYADQVIPKGETAGQAQRERKMRSVTSDLRQARSLFKRNLLPVYNRELNMPDLREFLEERPCDNPPAIREEHTPAEVSILKSGAKLKGKNDGLYAAWLLGYYLALRAGEMVAARWSWFEVENGRCELRVCRRPDEYFDPKGYDGWVPVALDVRMELLRLRRPDDPYILPGGNKTNRRKLVIRELAAWMREQGWDRPHCAHELRAYRGNVWRHTYGLDVARDWLRHKNVRTTQEHYTVNHNTSQKPLGMAG